MTTPPQTMTDLQTRALAAFIAELRPGWDTAGIVAALRSVRDKIGSAELAIAIIRGATDPTNETPAFIRYDNSRAFHDYCRTHPRVGVRVNGECAGCYADRLAAPDHPIDRGGQPPAEETHPLEAALARVERQPS